MSSVSKRLLVAVPLAVMVTGALFLAMRALTDVQAERPRIEPQLEIRIGRERADTDSRPGPPPPGCKAPGFPADGCAIPIYRPPVKYPGCGEGVGEVVLDFAVAADGTVHDIQVISASSRCFEWAATYAARRWMYRPMIVRGQPVRSRTQVRLVFEPERRFPQGR